MPYGVGNAPLPAPRGVSVFSQANSEVCFPQHPDDWHTTCTLRLSVDTHIVVNSLRKGHAADVSH